MHASGAPCALPWQRAARSRPPLRRRQGPNASAASPSGAILVRTGRSAGPAVNSCQLARRSMRLHSRRATI